MEYATNGSLGSTTTAYSFGVQRESFVETTAGMGAGATIGGMTYQSSGTYYYTGTGSVANVTGSATNQSYSYTTGGSMTAFVMSASAGMTSDGITGTLTTSPTAYGTYGVYGYNGEYTHTSLGLQYLRARYLNVATGTFTSRDTYAGKLQDILSQNRYTYAENNPVGRSDPSGHAPKKSGIGAMLQKTANTLTKMPMFTAPKARAATQASISNYMAEQNRKANNTEAQTASNQAFYNSARNAAHKEAEIRMDIWRFNMAGVAVMTANPGMVPWIESAATELEKANCAAYDWCINEIQKALIGKDAGRIAYGSSLILEGVGKVFGAAGLAKASTMVSATGVGTAIGIGGFAASAWLMACASADITQGAMEVYYGFKGDSLTPTVHVVKDSPIYGSNDLAYHLSTGVAASLGEIAGGLAAIRQPVSIKSDATSTNTLRQMARQTENSSSGPVSDIRRPGDVDFVGPIQDGSWRLTPDGAGAHLVERANVRGRTELTIYDQSNTPRYYPYGTPESAGQAHIRLHEATRNQGIRLRGNPSMSDDELLNNYNRAYSNPELSGIRGDLRTPNGSTVIATDVTPSEAFEALIEWGEHN